MILDELYLQLTDYLKTRLPDSLPDGLPNLQHFDLWAEQTEYLQEGENMPFNLPAAFFEFNTDEIQNLGALSRNFPFVVNVYVADFSLAESFDGSHDQPSALNYLRLVGAVAALLHGADVGSGTLSSLAIRRYATGTNLWIYVLSYTVEVIDHSSADVHRPLNEDDASLTIEKGEPEPPAPGSNNDYFIDLS